MLPTHIKLLFLLLASLLLQPLQAQDNRWFHFAPNDRMLSMVEDGDMLWVHTLDGLVSFDTRTNQFDYFDKTNSQLGSEYIHGMARVGGGGTVVVVTYDLGLILIENGNWTYLDMNNSPLPANDLISVSEDQLGGAWIITQSLPSLIRYDGENWDVYTVPDSGLADESQVVFVDHTDRVWVGTESRLLSFDGTNWEDHSPELVTAGCTWLSVDYLYEDQQERLWASVQGQLFRRDIVGSWQLMASGVSISNMSEDAAGQLWLTRNLGNSFQLMQYDESSDAMTTVGTTNSNIPFDAYASLYRSQEGSMWMGAHPGELTRYQNEAWQSYDLANSIHKERQALDISLDESENVFVLNPDQLSWYNGIQWQSLSLPHDEMGDKMAVLSPDQLWILNRTASRLSMYFFGQWVDYEVGSFFPAETELMGLELDGNGDLWIQEANSLYRLSGNQWSHFTSENSPLPADTDISVISADPSEGVWWTGPDAGILHYFDGNALNSFTNSFPGGTQPSKIRLHAAANGEVWLYNDHRLQRFDGHAFDEFTIDGEAWQSLNAMSSVGDTLIISSKYDVIFHHEGTATQFSPYNSPLRTGWPGKVVQDPKGNFWISNTWSGRGGLSLYHPDGVVYSDNALTSSIEPTRSIQATALRPVPTRFSDQTTLHYTISQPGKVLLELWDITGKKVQTLKHHEALAGEYVYPLEASHLSPGMYFVRLQQGQQRQDTEKIIVLPK